MADNPKNEYVDWLRKEGLENRPRGDVIKVAMIDALNTKLHLKFNTAVMTDEIAVNWMANNMDTLATAKYPAFAIEILNDEIQFVNHGNNDGKQRPSVDQMQQMIGILNQAQEAANEANARDEVAKAAKAAARASAASAPAPAPAPTKQEAADLLFQLIGDLHITEKITQETHDQAKQYITMLLSQNGGFRRRNKYTNKHNKSRNSKKSRNTKSRRH
jgi:hypothetical protein